MSHAETVAVAYFVLGATCWFILSAAYLRRGMSVGEQFPFMKIAIALPVIALWPLLIVALIRRDWRCRRRTKPEMDDPNLDRLA